MARRNPSKIAVLLHFVLGLCTGGIWWLLLLINHMLKSK